MKPLFDLHTHTIASGHAFSTLEENARAAGARGLEALGFSDHAPGMPGGPHRFYFENFRVVPDHIAGVRIYKGIEADILDSGGGLDVDERIASRLDYVIASLHPPCIAQGTVEENTRALTEAMKTPWVTIIGHPDDARYPLDYDALTEAAVEHGTALEVNSASFRPGAARRNARENNLVLLELCRARRVPVVLGSDAHIDSDVGELSRAMGLLAEIAFPAELVLNYSWEGLERVLIER